jgi:hypothetical protein
MIEVPEFKEVYRKEVRSSKNGVKVRTICEIQDARTDEVLAYGISAVYGEQNYDPELGKLLAYGKAMRYLFLILNHGEKTVEDFTHGQG